MPFKLLLLPLAPALAAPVLWAGTLLAVPIGGPAATRPVHSVAQLRQDLAASPRTWVGRVVDVRAVAYGCWALGGPGNATCRIWRPELLDSPEQTDGLALRWAAPDRLLSALRRLPLIGGLVPPPQVTRWDTPAIYRVQLRALPRPVPSGQPWAAAVLLDAAPGSE